jgi:hypothetical protein
MRPTQGGKSQRWWDVPTNWRFTRIRLGRLGAGLVREQQELVSKWHAKDKQLIVDFACEAASTFSAGPVAELNAAGTGKVTRSRLP